MKTNPRKWQAVLGAALFAAAGANAADLVWIGGSGNWDAAGNWSPAQVPGASWRWHRGIACD